MKFSSAFLLDHRVTEDASPGLPLQGFLSLESGCLSSVGRRRPLRTTFVVVPVTVVLAEGAGADESAPVLSTLISAHLELERPDLLFSCRAVRFSFPGSAIFSRPVMHAAIVRYRHAARLVRWRSNLCVIRKSISGALLLLQRAPARSGSSQFGAPDAMASGKRIGSPSPSQDGAFAHASLPPDRPVAFSIRTV